MKRTIADFEVSMAKIERFDAINQQILSVVDTQILEVNDAMNTLACILLDSISELSYDDADFVIDVVEQYYFGGSPGCYPLDQAATQSALLVMESWSAV